MNKESNEQPSDDEVRRITEDWLTRRPNVYGQPAIKDVDLEELSKKPVDRWARKIIEAPQAERDIDFISGIEETYGDALDPYKHDPSTMADIDEILDTRVIRVDNKIIEMVTLQETDIPIKDRTGKPDEVARHRWNEEAIEGFLEDEPYPKGDPIWIEASLMTLRYPSYLHIGQDLIDSNLDDEEKRKCAIFSLLRQRDGYDPSFMIRFNELVGYNGILFDFPERDEK